MLLVPSVVKGNADVERSPEQPVLQDLKWWWWQAHERGALPHGKSCRAAPCVEAAYMRFASHVSHTHANH
eukprot:5550172-Amphidinium_carterae.1